MLTAKDVYVNNAQPETKKFWDLARGEAFKWDRNGNWCIKTSDPRNNIYGYTYIEGQNNGIFYLPNAPQLSAVVIQ